MSPASPSKVNPLDSATLAACSSLDPVALHLPLDPRLCATFAPRRRVARLGVWHPWAAPLAPPTSHARLTLARRWRRLSLTGNTASRTAASRRRGRVPEGGECRCCKLVGERGEEKWIRVMVRVVVVLVIYKVWLSSHLGLLGFGLF